MADDVNTSGNWQTQTPGCTPLNAEPAPAPGANDAPWLARLRRLASMPMLADASRISVGLADLQAAVEAVDAQAARLAAVEQERDATVRRVQRRIESLRAWANPICAPPSHANLRDVADDLQAAIAGAVGEGRDGG